VNFSITEMPTLCTPEKLNRKQLIEQVNYLQKEAFEQVMDLDSRLGECSEKLYQTHKIAGQLNAQLLALCDSYDAGDQAALLLQLKKLSDRRKEYEAKKGQVR
jgi:hypothetical protein